MANMSVEAVAPGIFRVGSASSDRTYVVDLTAGTCTCPNWAIQRNRLKGQLERDGKPTNNIQYSCKHMKEVGVVPLPKTRKKPVQRDSKEVAKKKADAIVAKFTRPAKGGVVDDLAKLIEAAKRK